MRSAVTQAPVGGVLHATIEVDGLQSLHREVRESGVSGLMLSPGTSLASTRR